MKGKEMKGKEILYEIVWKLRYADPFYYFFLIFLKLHKVSKEEKDKAIRGIYDLRVFDPVLFNIRNDWLWRLTWGALLLTLIMSIITYLKISS